MPVHLFGQSANMAPLLELARKHGLRVIEDNAQAFGAEYRGRKTGGLGDVGCLSFFPSKNLGAYGDAGMVVSNDGGTAERLRMLRVHGWRKKYFPEMIGYNSRLDELQAAILRVKLRHLDAWTEGRRALAGWYDQKLAPLGIGVPVEARYGRHVYYLYVIRVQDRDRIIQELKAAGIASEVYYPQPLHLSAPCRVYGYREGDFPVSEQASRETLAIPIYPEMSPEQREAVVAALARAVAGGEGGS